VTSRVARAVALFGAIVVTAAAAAGQTAPLAGIPFAGTNGGEPYNASGAVALGDGRFLFCDNNAGDALYELELTPAGAQKGPIVRRPLGGVAPGTDSDFEGMTTASAGDARFVVVASSLSVRKGGRVVDGLVRVSYAPTGVLRAETMPGFRAWLVARVPSLAKAAALVPDASGLNVEGLAWDASRSALLFALRSPVADGKPLVIPVKVKDLAGPWTTENLEVMPEIRLAIEPGAAAEGVRDIQYDPVRKVFLVIVGRSVSGTDAEFRLYAWDGNAAGAVRRFANVSFPPKMKPEGVTTGTVGGRRAIVVLDDRGGFATLFDDDPRAR
jgi:hypothetical protein